MAAQQVHFLVAESIQSNALASRNVRSQSSMGGKALVAQKDSELDRTKLDLGLAAVPTIGTL